MASVNGKGACPRPSCGSSDAYTTYDDGTAFCFSCQNYFPDASDIRSEQRDITTKVKDFKPRVGHFQDLTNREITEETCRFWQYQVGDVDGVPSHIMNVRDEKGALVAQKFRTKEYKGRWEGDAKNPPLYGIWLWPSKGRSVTITEGEIDAMSVSQVFGNRWPVVSLPNGTGSVKKSLARCYDWLNGFENIVLMFDMDGPGREAVEIAVELLPPGKVKIATLPEKDANDTLIKHGAEAVSKAFWNAKVWAPDGIVDGAEFTLERVKTATTAGFGLRFPKLQGMTFGLRKRELTLFTAGSGIGKSTLLREFMYDLHQTHTLKLGNIFLEESNEKTAQAYVALHNNVPLGKLRHNPSILTDDQWQRGLHDVVHQRMKFYDHFGSLESANLINKIVYLAKVEKCDFIALDHISIVTSGLESGSEGERKDIDILMTKLQQVIQSTGVGILAVVHLKRKPGTSFNNGAQVSLSDLRGSGSLEQLSDNVIALERDQQAEGDDKCKELIRILKCRETGDTGEADEIIYDRNTGRLVLEVEKSFDPAHEIGDTPQEF